MSMSLVKDHEITTGWSLREEGTRHEEGHHSQAITRAYAPDDALHTHHFSLLCHHLAPSCFLGAMNWALRDGTECGAPTS